MSLKRSDHFSVMPFGKYKGHPLEQLPDRYVDWLLSQEWVTGFLRSSLAFRHELAERFGTRPVEPIQAYGGDARPSMQALRSGSRARTNL